MKICQRTRASNLTAYCNFPFPMEQISLKVTATPTSWKQFYFYLMSEPKAMRELILHNLAQPAYEYLSKKPVRGVHAGREEFQEKAKYLSALLFYRASYWLRRPRRLWPTALVELVREIEPELVNHCGRKRKVTELQIVIHIMETCYGKERRKQGLKPWGEDPEQFRKIYVKNIFGALFEKGYKPATLMHNGKPVLTNEDPKKIVQFVQAVMKSIS